MPTIGGCGRSSKPGADRLQGSALPTRLGWAAMGSGLVRRRRIVRTLGHTDERPHAHARFAHLRTVARVRDSCKCAHLSWVLVRRWPRGNVPVMPIPTERDNALAVGRMLTLATLRRMYDFTLHERDSLPTGSDRAGLDVVVDAFAEVLRVDHGQPPA